MERESFDVIIIGGGAAGTACAALLSKWGLKILLIEKESNLGGRASTLELPNGFYIDSGVHGIPYYDLGSLKLIEKELNIDLELVDYDPLLAFYDTEEEICVEVSDFSNKGFKEIDRIWGNGQFIKLLNILRKATDEEADKLDDISVKDYFGQFSKYIQFQQLLRAINGMITITPELGSAGEFIRSFSKLFSSKRPITYPKSGGIQSLSELMSDICKENGGEIRTATNIKEILVENGKVLGVKADYTDKKGETIQQEFNAQSIIVTIPLQFLFQIISQEYFSETFVNKIESLQDTQSCAQGIGFTFKEGLLKDFLWNPKCWGAIVFQPGKKPRYLSVPTALVEDLAPPGKHYLFYGVVATPQEVKDKKATKALIKELIDEINKLFPRLKEFKIWHFSGSSEMVLGTAKRVGLTGQFKPANLSPDVEGLFFAGDTAAGGGPGLECAYNSAMRCSKKVYEYVSSRSKKEGKKSFSH
ncbi:MAG: NAD(P)/FAD-dependent oxidoreductase [Candidatus Helarchaeota archaeon]|nr:NAD(P)/FAD-dependent oxidoreductase [Candidatus Helarchaeota archaeon]